MTALELDPAYCRLGGGRVVVVHHPGLHVGQHIIVTIGRHVHHATVTAVRPKWSIAQLGGAV